MIIAKKPNDYYLNPLPLYIVVTNPSKLEDIKQNMIVVKSRYDYM